MLMAMRCKYITKNVPQGFRLSLYCLLSMGSDAVFLIVNDVTLEFKVLHRFLNVKSYLR